MCCGPILRSRVPNTGKRRITSPDLHAGTQYVRLESQATIPPKKPAVAAAFPSDSGGIASCVLLGRGQSGDVYLAEDTQLDPSIAV